jgi:hypothetical protein
MAESEVKIELAAELERARGRLARNFGALRQDLDVAAHLKHSLSEHKTAYIGGATLLGLLLSKLPARKKKVYVERKSKDAVKEVEKAGIWIVLLQLIFKAFQPMLTSLVSRQLSSYLKARATGSETRARGPE